MSEEFDKEAEREKLREKFADDDQKREHTQRMSELLLRGATMTNRHCDDCGDPIFRQDGQEFCPSCHTVDAADVDGDPETNVDGTTVDRANTGSATAAGETPDAKPQSQPRGRNAGSQPRPTGEGSVSDLNRVDADADNTRDTQQIGSDTTQRPTDEPQRATPSSRLPSESHSTSTAGSPATETVTDARDSLTRTLTRFARKAEATDDPRRAKEYLQAAHEAAEALSALD